MISLMFALLAGPAVAETQAVQAEFQACALENGRYVCRYVVPDIVIVPVPGSNITADAPAAVLGSAPSATEATATPRTAVPAIPLGAAPPVMLPTTAGPAATTTPIISPTAAPVIAVVDPGPIRPIDTDVLTEREAQLVARCADAGWVSLCLPDDRRAARSLRDKQTAYLAVRREVTRLLGENRCEAAVRSALDGGYLSLARETRDYCAPPTTPPTATASSTAAPGVSSPPAAAVPVEDEAVDDQAGKDDTAKAQTETGTAKVEAEAEAAEG